MLKLKSIIILTFVYLQIAKSCTCQQNFDFLISDYLLYDNIFYGNCIDITGDSANKINIYTFEIKDEYKGKSSKFLKVKSYHSTELCGSQFKINNNYLIFSVKGFTTLCYGNIAFDSDSINLWGLNQKSSVLLSDSFQYLNGNEFMLLFNKTKQNKINVLKQLKETRNGIIYSYFTDGNINSFISVKHGKFNGPAIFYFQNRKIKFRGEFKNGKKHGHCEEYKYEYSDLHSKFQYIKEVGKYKLDNRIGAWKSEIIELNKFFFQ